MVGTWTLVGDRFTLHINDHRTEFSVAMLDSEMLELVGSCPMGISLEGVDGPRYKLQRLTNGST